jgi:hypothetical protein
MRRDQADPSQWFQGINELTAGVISSSKPSYLERGGWVLAFSNTAPLALLLLTLKTSDFAQ